MRSRQSGMSLIAYLIVLALVGFIIYLGMKIGPTYLEYYTLRKAVDRVAAEAEAADIGSIRSKMERQMTIDYAEFKPEFVTVQRDNNQLNLVLNYEIRKPLVYNLDFVAKFQHSAPIRRP